MLSRESVGIFAEKRGPCGLVVRATLDDGEIVFSRKVSGELRALGLLTVHLVRNNALGVRVKPERTLGILCFVCTESRAVSGASVGFA